MPREYLNPNKINPEELSKPQETKEETTHNCGVVGVWGPDDEKIVLRAIKGLNALNHRGQEGAGLSMFDPKGGVRCYKEAGLVQDVFPWYVQKDLSTNNVLTVIGQTRYSTSGERSAWQPFMDEKTGFAMVHNGNLTNARKLLNLLPEEVRKKAVSDSWIAHKLILHWRGDTWEEKISSACQKMEGAYNLIMQKDNRLFVVRGPHGFHPLVLGEVPGGGIAVASETRALVKMGASYLGEVREGVGLVIDENGVSEFFQDKKPLSRCVFEPVYFSSPESLTFGLNTAEVRRALGQRLALRDLKEGFVPDIIVPVQRSGIIFAEGYAQEMIKMLSQNAEKYGIKPEDLPAVISRLYPSTAIIASNNSLRVFINPESGNRDRLTNTKHSVNPYDLAGKKVILVDDSVVRGTASQELLTLMNKTAELMRVEKPKGIHLRVGFPPIAHPCFMGIDFSDPKELVVNSTPGKNIEEELSRKLGYDSIHFVTAEDLNYALGGELNNCCTACFSGNYPVEVNQSELFGK